MYYIDGGPILTFAFGLLATAILLTALTDRISFDGRRLYSIGVLQTALVLSGRFPKALKLRDVEFVQTMLFRKFRRGGRVFYTYRTSFHGRGLTFEVSGGGLSYRRMMASVLPLLPEDVLDRHSIEIRNYVAEPQDVLSAAKEIGIPAAEVLENSFDEGRRRSRGRDTQRNNAVKDVARIRTIANQLKVSGRLVQALEAFRRALLSSPQDGWLLLEAARCLQAFASVRRDPYLDRKAAALLRLSERRAGEDAQLLAVLGESYCQFGHWKRASKVFQRSIDLCGGTVRTLRGMAEVALSEGKIAHVIHNFAAASRIVGSPSQRRWTSAEAEYFSQLNDEEEYFEMEIARLDLLETLGNLRGSGLRISLFGIAVLISGLVFDEVRLANLGWAVTGISLVVFAVSGLVRRLFLHRIPAEVFRET